MGFYFVEPELEQISSKESGFIKWFSNESTEDLNFYSLENVGVSMLLRGLAISLQSFSKSKSDSFTSSWTLRENEFGERLCVGCPPLDTHLLQLWINAVKAVLSEIWFERNQRIFEDKSLNWLDRFEIARIKASFWCSLSKKSSYCSNLRYLS